MTIIICDNEKLARKILVFVGMGDAETIYETYYDIALHPFVSIIPNLRYVTNPLGRKDVKGEFTTGLRFVILV